VIRQADNFGIRSLNLGAKMQNMCRMTEINELNLLPVRNGGQAGQSHARERRCELLVHN
jgi:hypothetical protein